MSNYPMTKVIILYGWKKDLDGRDFIPVFEEIAQKVELKISRTEIEFEGSEGISRPRFSQLKGMARANDRRKLSGIAVYSSMADVERYGFNRLEMSAVCGSLEGDIGKRVAIGLSSAEFNKSLLTSINIFEALLGVVTPMYGFATEISGKIGSTFFSTGAMPCGDDFADEQMRILRNSNVEIFESRIRDVYDINFLSKEHLARTVDGSPLINWVIKNDFGDIQSFGQNNWVWSAPKSRIGQIRVLLKAQDILV